MSDTVLQLGDVYLTRFAGGTATAAGRRDPGTCYSLMDGLTEVTLTRQEAIQVAHAILADVQAETARRVKEALDALQARGARG